MAHPVLWSKKTSFYPIGNAPPACLTQNLSPEKSADILLLGCGDPRSILYTVYADLAAGNRHLDFTCCDLEPAVLARNILLLTMIADGISTDAAWSIFYHFFLDETSHNILIAQCRTLIQSSSNMETWRDSKYGSSLRFCTEHSLAEIRRHWGLYAESQDFSESERKALRASFHSGMQGVRKNHKGEAISTLRAAGPLYMSIHLKSVEAFTSFWTTGVTPSKSSQGISAPYVNPTFVYSRTGRKFNVHYSTNPIAAFYLAPGLALDKNGKPPAAVTPEDFVDSAKLQFAAGCASFKARLSSGSAANITIRFFVGEALNFCRALHVCKEQKTTETGIYSHTWGGPPIALDAGDYSSSSASPAPLQFNVIDTSDLADHIGLLNLLVATVPLLERKPWSVIHTNTLLRSDPPPPAKSGLSEIACADIPTLSMLLGVAPSPHLWHFTSHSTKHEVMTADPSTGQLPEILSWRFVSAFVPNTTSKPQDTDVGNFKLVCDAAALAEFFFSVYLRMFATENPALYLQNPGPAAHLKKQNAVHYTRESLVALLALAKGNVKVDWPRAMDHLVDLIGDDQSLLMGLNGYQDLMCQLYLRGVHTLDVLTPAYAETVRRPRDRFQGWKEVPPVVCVVLKVPRQQLKSLEDMDADELMTPILQCEIYGPSFHNIYSSVHLAFGETSVSVVGGEPQVTIDEDPKGWSGSSALIATFYLPSWTLCNAPAATKVGLHVRSTPLSIRLKSQLGMRLAIFSTPLTDATNIHVVRHRPGNAQEVERLRQTPGYNASTASENVREIMMKFNPSGDKATNLVIRKEITEADAASSLASGSKVVTKPLTDSSVLVVFGDHKYRLRYPFPVQMKRLQMRIARKSSFIELETPVRPDFSDFRDLSLNPFAEANDDKQVNLLNIHYLKLDILPAISLPGKEEDLGWLNTHIALTLSKAETEARLNPFQPARGTFVNVKDTTACLFLKYAGLQVAQPQDWSSVFGLSDPLNGGVYTYIFVNAMKFDLGSHTIVLDACVVPLADRIMPTLAPALDALRHRHFVELMTHADEKRMWTLLLPLLAERCRTWQHTDACEYRARGVPASVDVAERSPLCSCGKGKDLGRFGTVTEWAPFRDEATRVAIGPLFPFSFPGANSSSGEEDKGPSKLQCAKCRGPGKPQLLVCTACKKTQYCSRECQKADWKVHKKICAAVAK